MSKELEALYYFLGSYKEFLKGKDTYCQITLTREQATEFIKEVDEVKQALQRLESIDNANYSEALKCLERINKEYATIECEDFDICYATINQALLKSQKQEKENAEYKKVLEILKPYLRLVNNYLQVKAIFYDDLWMTVKEIDDEEELEVLKKILGQTQI